MQGYSQWGVAEPPIPAPPTSVQSKASVREEIARQKLLDAVRKRGTLAPPPSAKLGIKGKDAGIALGVAALLNMIEQDAGTQGLQGLMQGLDTRRQTEDRDNQAMFQAQQFGLGAEEDAAKIEYGIASDELGAERAGLAKQSQFEQEAELKMLIANMEQTAKGQAAAKAEERQNRTNLEQAITSFNTKIQSARSSFQGVLPDDLSVEYKRQFGELSQHIKNSGFDNLPALEPVMSRKTAAGQNSDDQKARQANQDRIAAEDREYRRNRDLEMDRRWQITFDQQYGEPKTTRERGTAIKKMEGDIKKARDKVDALRFAPYDPAPDPDEDPGKGARDSKNKVWDAVYEEFLLVKSKREMAGGAVPTFDQYVAERYPDLGSLFGMNVNALMGNVNRNNPGREAPRATTNRPRGKTPPAPPKGFTAPRVVG